LSFTCGENKAQYLVYKTTQKTQKVEQAFQMKGMEVGEGKKEVYKVDYFAHQ
jgi:hypothetical protein